MTFTKQPKRGVIYLVNLQEWLFLCNSEWLLPYLEIDSTRLIQPKKKYFIDSVAKRYSWK